MTTILKLTAICAICAATLVTGCIEQSGPEIVPYENIVHDNPVPVQTYTKTDIVFSIGLTTHGIDGAYIDNTSVSDEYSTPYTEYDWAQGMSIDDFADMTGMQNYTIETVYEKSSYPASDKYVYNGWYIIYYEDGEVSMVVSSTSTRY